MKKADASGATFALVIGDDEAAAGTVARQAPARAAASRSPCPRRNWPRICTQRTAIKLKARRKDEHGSLRSRRAGKTGRPQGLVGPLGQHRGDRARRREPGRRRRPGLALVDCPRKAEDAAVLFNAVVQAARANDVAKAKDAVTALADKFADTGYAPRAAFLRRQAAVRRRRHRRGARAQLQWVVDHADEQELKEIARYRLAELMLQRQAVRRGAEDAGRQARRSVRGPLRRPSRRCALRPPTAPTTRAPPTRRRSAKLDPKSPYRNYVAGEAGFAAWRCGNLPRAAPAARAGATPAPHRRRSARAGRAHRGTLRNPHRRRSNDAQWPNALLARHAFARHGAPHRAWRSRWLALAGCATMAEYMPTIPSPSIRWLFNSKKLGPAAGTQAVRDGDRSIGRRRLARRVRASAPAVLTDADLHRDRATAR